MELEIIKSNTGIQLVNDVLSKKISLTTIELRVKVKDTIGKPIVRSVFKNKEEIAFTFINGIVKRFVDSFGFSTKMTESQVEMLTVDTLENFSYESIEDIILFFKMARSGKLGTTGRGVDSNLIFGDWFPKYMEQKSETRERQYEKEKQSMNIDQRGASYDNVMKRYKDDAEKSFKKRVIDYVDNITKDCDRQMLEDLIVDWEKDPERSPYIDIIKKKRLNIRK